MYAGKLLDRRIRLITTDKCRDLVPLGQTKTKFNFNLDEKRLLNFENVVNDDDNIKQDLSIDVYGRKEKAEEEEAAAKAAEAPVCSLKLHCCVLFLSGSAPPFLDFKFLECSCNPGFIIFCSIIWNHTQILIS